MTWSNGCSVTSSLWPILFIFASLCRSSILSEVSTRSSSKLPSGKNILVFGRYYMSLYLWRSTLIQCCQCLCDHWRTQTFGKATLNTLLIACLPPVFFIRHNKTKHSEVYSSRKYWVGLWQIKKCCHWTEILVKYCWPAKVIWLNQKAWSVFWRAWIIN